MRDKRRISFLFMAFVSTFAFLLLSLTACDCGKKPDPEITTEVVADGGSEKITEVGPDGVCPVVGTPCKDKAECQACGNLMLCDQGRCVEDAIPDTTCPVPGTTCQSDNECQLLGCAALSCIAGACATVIPDDKECPATCVSSDDCKTQRCGDRIACLNGVCSPAQKPCPDACTQDADCQTPSCGANIVCLQGKCSSIPECPGACKQDSDCQTPACGPKTQCLSNACSEPIANKPPEAIIAPLVGVVEVGNRVILDGRQSKDPEGQPLKFQWRFAKQPQGSQTAFDDSTSQTPAFVPDLPGDYEIELVVNDGVQDSKPATILIPATQPGNPPPQLATLDPLKVEEGYPATKVSAKGSNFVSGLEISFDGKAVATAFVSATEVTFELPAGLKPGQYKVYATNPDQKLSNTLSFEITVKPIPPPTLTKIEPVEVAENTAFTLKAFGSDFQTGCTLEIKGQPPSAILMSLPCTFVSDKEVSGAASGFPAGTFDVVVKNPDGQTSSSLSFRVTVAPAGPVLLSIAPTSVFAQQTFLLTLKGDRFVSGAQVFVATQAFPSVFVSATELRATLNLTTPGTFPVVVQNPNGQRSNNLVLEVKPPLSKPQITALVPATAVEKTAVTVLVQGSDFRQGAKVTFRGTEYPSTFGSATELKVSLPPTLTPGNYPVVVENPDAQKSNSVDFKVTPKPAAPSITKIDPDRVEQGTNVLLKITGKDFQQGAQVQIGARLYNPTFKSSTDLELPLPTTLTAGNYPVVVFNPDSQKSNAVNLTIFRAPPPILTKISPDKGISGDVITIKLEGKDFRQGARALFQGGAQNTSFLSSSELQMTISLSGIAPGTYQISVRNPDGQDSQKLNFTVDAPAGPQIQQILPKDGATNTKVNVIVDGAGFVTGAKFLFNSQSLATNFLNASTLGLTLDLTGVAAGIYPVQVENPSGDKSNFAYFTVSSQKLPAPILTSVTPSTIKLGNNDPIYLLGSHFQNGAVFQLQLPFIGSVGLPANYINSNTLIVTAQLPSIPFPFPPQRVSATVKNPDGQVSNAVQVTVQP